MIVRPLLLSVGLVVAAALAAHASTTQLSSCEGFRSWFSLQPGSKLVLSASNNFDQKFASPTRRDNILDYSTIPASSDGKAWYKLMKHFRSNVGNGRCFSAYYDSASKAALVLSENGTGSDLTITNVSGTPVGLPNHAVPAQTQNGVRLGMTLAQVRAIDGQGTLTSNGTQQRLFYSQDVYKSGTRLINYLGFLFLNGKLVASDVGGGV
jgi:hypothetical protein